MRKRWMLWLAVTIHLLWGILILASGEMVTAITAIHTTMSVLGTAQRVAFAYILASVLTLAAIIFEKRIGVAGELLCLMPQQFLLMLSAFGAINAIWISAFADGIVRARSFLAADQGIAILVAIFHTLTILEVFGGNLSFYLLNLWETFLSRWGPRSSL